MANVATFGEIMMRLATPDHERFLQANRFDVTYAGAEASVAVSLAAFGHEASFVTALPLGPLGDAAVGHLRYYGVDTSQIVRTKEGRMGVYFLEAGAAQRPSKVIYDRAGSSVAVTPAASYDWEKILEGKKAFHTTGITPALSEDCAEATTAALRVAKNNELFTSFDLNYRAKLWNNIAARQAIQPLMPHIDLLVGNEEDAEKVLGIRAPKSDVSKGMIDHGSYEFVARQIHEQYGPKYVAITLRESVSATVNHWSACLFGEGKFLLSQRYTIHVVDRVGAGDAFCGALLTGLIERQPLRDALEFAVAASCLKHSIHGDFNKVSRDEVERLAGGEASGRVVR